MDELFEGLVGLIAIVVLGAIALAFAVAVFVVALFTVLGSIIAGIVGFYVWSQQLGSDDAKVASGISLTFDNSGAVWKFDSDKVGEVPFWVAGAAAGGSVLVGLILLTTQQTGSGFDQFAMIASFLVATGIGIYVSFWFRKTKESFLQRWVASTIEGKFRNKFAGETHALTEIARLDAQMETKYNALGIHAGGNAASGLSQAVLDYALGKSGGAADLSEMKTRLERDLVELDRCADQVSNAFALLKEAEEAAIHARSATLTARVDDARRVLEDEAFANLFVDRQWQKISGLVDDAVNALREVLDTSGSFQGGANNGAGQQRHSSAGNGPSFDDDGVPQNAAAAYIIFGAKANSDLETLKTIRKKNLHQWHADHNTNDPKLGQTAHVMSTRFNVAWDLIQQDRAARGLPT
jgi:hypothetical protein